MWKGGVRLKMKEQPESGIVMSKREVVALLSGNKTRSSYPVIPQPVQPVQQPVQVEGKAKSPFGNPGDWLYVKECWLAGFQWSPADYDRILRGDIRLGDYVFEAAYEPSDPQFSIHEFEWLAAADMPISAARLRLRILTVQVMHIADVTDNDAKLEGFAPRMSPVGSLISARQQYLQEWDIQFGIARFPEEHISWSQNPLIWAVDYVPEEISLPLPAPLQDLRPTPAQA